MLCNDNLKRGRGDVCCCSNPLRGCEELAFHWRTAVANPGFFQSRMRHSCARVGFHETAPAHSSQGYLIAICCGAARLVWGVNRWHGGACCPSLSTSVLQCGWRTNSRVMRDGPLACKLSKQPPSLSLLRVQTCPLLPPLAGRSWRLTSHPGMDLSAACVSSPGTNSTPCATPRDAPSYLPCPTPFWTRTSCLNPPSLCTPPR